MKRKRVINMQPSLMVGFLVIVLALFTVIGCSEDVSKDVSNPAPSTFEPEGIIQGYLRDSTTNEPIVGAKVSVGLGEDTTDAKGQFVIRDVPATTDGLNGSVVGTYNVTIDLRIVTSPVDMTEATATQRYPEFAYSSVSVKYTSLNDTECQDSFDSNSDDADDAETCNTSSNHDTPVENLVAGLPLSVGRLACNIKGTVYGCDNTAKTDYYDEYATLQTAQVRLVAGASTSNTGTGISGNIVIPATDTTNGEFELSNIECGGVSYTLVAADDLDDPIMHDSLTVSSPDGIGETLVLHLEENSSESNPAKDQVLHLCPNDDIGPKIVSVSPETGSDLPKASSQTVTFTFHEAVAQNAYSSTDGSGVNNLYDNIEVRFDGTKASNVSYSAAWLPSACTDDCTQLQVTFPTGTSSKYHVKLLNVDSLRDTSGNAASMGICSDDSTISDNWDLNGDTVANNSTTGDAGTTDCTLAFSTTGGNTPSQVTDLVLVNDASLDEAGTDIGFYDWSPVSGAKDYVMYCQKVQVWGGTTTQEGPFVKDDTTLPLATDGIAVNGSTAQVDFDILADGIDNSTAFVENSHVELRWNCQVAGVNQDNEEGPLSAILSDPADDEIGPLLEEDGSDLDCGTGVEPDGAGAGDSGALCDDGSSVSDIVLEFNEELSETSAETATNYTISGLSAGTATVSTAVYDAVTDSVLLTLTTAVNPLYFKVTRITTGSNGVANTTVTGDDTQVIAVNSGAAGGAGGPCVIDNGPDTTESGDDVDTGREITAGANGDCETTAVSADGDEQLQPVSTNSRPSGTCVVDTTPYMAASVDDTIDGGTDGVATGEDYIHVGANGVCNTTVDSSGTQVISVGSGVANTTAITGGANALLDTETLSSDDTLVGGVVTVSGVTDVGGNTIRAAGDTYYSDGSVR